MSFLSSTVLSPIPVTPPPFVPGQAVLAVGIQSGMGTGSYGQPYILEDVLSASTVFGTGRFLQAIGELYRQSAPSIVAIALSQEEDLEGMFDYMVDQPFSILLPVGLEATSDRISTLAAFAYTREQIGLPITVVMSTDPTPGVDALVASNVGNSAGIISGTPDTVLAKYFVLTLDQVMVNPGVPSQYQADAAPSIAGLIGRTPPATSITYESLVGLDLLDPYSATDCTSLATAGYCVLTNSIRHGVVPFSGVTATSSNSASSNYSANFHRLSTQRICQYTVLLVRAATENYIGSLTSSGLQDTVKAVLTSLVADGILVSYQMSITVAQNQGTVYINLSLLCPNETSAVTVTSQIVSIRS